VNLQTVASPRLVSRLFGSGPVPRLALLRAFWPGAVGPDIARRTEVVALEGRTLRIRVPDARWRKVLHRMQREIRGRLFAALGELAPSQLSFVEEPVPIPPPDPPSAPVERAEPSAALVAGAAAIADPELRARFLKTAARYLNRAAKP
jgi:Dna[CI] antecedent, DciA